jgi:hypothetical protein
VQSFYTAKLTRASREIHKYFTSAERFLNVNWTTSHRAVAKPSSSNPVSREMKAVPALLGVLSAEIPAGTFPH